MPPTAPTYSAQFETLWKPYPRKLAKAKTHRVVLQRVSEGWTWEELTLASEGYATDVAVNDVPTRFIKHPTTFFGPNEWFAEFVPDREPELFDPAMGESLRRDMQYLDLDASVPPPLLVMVVCPECDGQGGTMADDGFVICHICHAKGQVERPAERTE